MIEHHVGFSAPQSARRVARAPTRLLELLLLDARRHPLVLFHLVVVVPAKAAEPAETTGAAAAVAESAAAQRRAEARLEHLQPLRVLGLGVGLEEPGLASPLPSP